MFWYVDIDRMEAVAKDSSLNAFVWQVATDACWYCTCQPQ